GDRRGLRACRPRAAPARAPRRSDRAAAPGAHARGGAGVAAPSPGAGARRERPGQRGGGAARALRRRRRGRHARGPRLGTLRRRPPRRRHRHPRPRAGERPRRPQGARDLRHRAAAHGARRAGARAAAAGAPAQPAAADRLEHAGRGALPLEWRRGGARRLAQGDRARRHAVRRHVQPRHGGGAARAARRGAGRARPLRRHRAAATFRRRHRAGAAAAAGARRMRDPRPLSRARGVALLATLLAAGALAAGCHRGARFEHAPVVLISIDTLRSDHVGVYGAKTGTTPKIDAFAREAMLFERAYSHYPLTLPSHVSLLSGELPGTHGVRDNVGYPFDPDKHPFLPRLLKGLGYDTGGAVSAFVLRAQTGLGPGCDYYESSLQPPAHVTLDMVQRPGGETAKLALDWLRGRKDAERPFFLFFHLYEPHSPYEPPQPFASRFRDPYDGEVATADDIVGNFLDELKKLGVYDRAVVLLVSDHGEGLDEHGEGQHG